ncbi:hypothetical protein HT031_004026 [Scenedesmus sp. PABB004]|nr:hypothetical protein HT031_004026 [Scenedesmus sp. PABB004]
MLPRISIQPDLGRLGSKLSKSTPAHGPADAHRSKGRPCRAPQAAAARPALAPSSRRSLDQVPFGAQSPPLPLGSGEGAPPGLAASVAGTASPELSASSSASDLALLLGGGAADLARPGSTTIHIGSVPIQVPLAVVAVSGGDAAAAAAAVEADAAPRDGGAAQAAAAGESRAARSEECAQSEGSSGRASQLSAASAEFYPQAYLAAAAATALAARSLGARSSGSGSGSCAGACESPESPAAEEALEERLQAQQFEVEGQQQQQQQQQYAAEEQQQQQEFVCEEQQPEYAAQAQPYPGGQQPPPPYWHPQQQEQHAPPPDPAALAAWQHQQAAAAAAWQQQQHHMAAWHAHQAAALQVPVPVYYPVPVPVGLPPFAAVPATWAFPGHHHHPGAAPPPSFAAPPGGGEHAGDAGSGASTPMASGWAPPPPHGPYAGASRPGSSAGSVASGFSAASRPRGHGGAHAARDAGTVTVSSLSCVKDAAGALAKVVSRHGSCLLLSLSRAGDQAAAATHVAAKSLAVARFYVNAHMAAAGAAGVGAAAALTGLAGGEPTHAAPPPRSDEELVFVPFARPGAAAQLGDAADPPLGFVVAKASAAQLAVALPPPVGVPACMAGRDGAPAADGGACAGAGAASAGAAAAAPLLKAGAHTDVNKLSNAIIHNVLGGGHVALQLAGAAACGVAMRALLRARCRLQRKFGADVVATASFANEDTRGAIGRSTVFLRLDVMRSSLLSALADGAAGAPRGLPQQAHAPALAPAMLSGGTMSAAPAGKRRAGPTTRALRPQLRQARRRLGQRRRQGAASPLARSPRRTSALLPELPEPLVLHVLGFLSPALQAWAAKLVCKAARERFRGATAVSLRCPELPLAAVQEAWRAVQDDGWEQQWRLPPIAQARAACGDVAGLAWLRAAGCDMDDVCYPAAQAGQLAVLEWARGEGLDLLATPPVPWGRSDVGVCYSAARRGDLEMLRWARPQAEPAPWTEWACCAAAREGHLEALRWLRANGCPWGRAKCEYWAAENGHEAVVAPSGGAMSAALEGERCAGSTTRARAAAAAAAATAAVAAAGEAPAGAEAAPSLWRDLPEPLVLHVLSLLPPALQAWTARLVCKAARERFRGAISVRCPELPLAAVQEAWRAAQDDDWQQQRQRRQQRRLARARAVCGDVAGLAWLYRAGCDMGGEYENESVCWEAAKHGHFAVLEWARDVRLDLRLVCKAAAYGGQLGVLRWARAQTPPLPWGDSWCGVCFLAARCGDVEMLRWARAQAKPAPWDAQACAAAAEHGHLEALRWLRTNGCPWWRARCERAAADKGHDAVVAWIRAQPN